MCFQCINKREGGFCVILNQMVRERQQNENVEKGWTLALQRAPPEGNAGMYHVVSSEWQ